MIEIILVNKTERGKDMEEAASFPRQSDLGMLTSYKMLYEKEIL